MAPRAAWCGAAYWTASRKHPRKLRLLRLHDGKPTPVEVDAGDPNALRLPLLPGDRVEWE